MGGPSAPWGPRENSGRRREHAGSEWTLIQRVEGHLEGSGGGVGGEGKDSTCIHREQQTKLENLLHLSKGFGLRSMVLLLLQIAQGAEFG